MYLCVCVCAGLVVAAGHEGSGLALGPATAQLVLHHLLGAPHAGSPAHVAEALGALDALLPTNL